MPFFEILKELVDGAGAGSAATIMGVDGLSVQHYPADNPPCDVESIGVEYGGAIEEMKKASRILSLGELEEVVVTTPGADLVLRMITPEYYMVLAVSRSSSVGKARYLAKRAARKAGKELTR
jgi:predicted regulator of Ras-like GTPase activity (Roadblock/LC7/MglB family)